MLLLLATITGFQGKAQKISTVKNLLSVSSNSLKTLCTSPAINKWSKYKPEQNNWPASSNGHYGIYIFNDWNYQKPTSGFRLGNFRNYDPGAKPPLYVDAGQSVQESDLYPSGYPQHSDWQFTVNTSPASGELSCSSLGLSPYYLGMKVTSPAGTYFKTYDQISATGTKTISLSAALTSYTPPYAFANLPYAIGPFTVEFGFCSGQSPDWGTTNPGFHLLPPSAPSVNCINSFTFWVHPWAHLSVTTLTWPANDLNYKTTHINTSLSNWEVTGKPAWVTLSAWHGTTQVTDPSLWNDDMDIRITPTDNNNTSVRNGTITIGTGSTTLASVNIAQEAKPQQLPEAYVVNIGFNISSSNATVSLGSTTVTYSLTPTNAGASTMGTAELFKNGVSVGTQNVVLRDNKATSGSFSLSVPADYDDKYEVRVSMNGGLF